MFQRLKVKMVINFSKETLPFHKVILKEKLTKSQNLIPAPSGTRSQGTTSLKVAVWPELYNFIRAPTPVFDDIYTSPSL